MLDRSKQPKSFPIDDFKLVQTISHTLKNTVVLTGLHDPAMELIRLDIRLKAGSYFQQKQAVSQATIKLITEGTHLLSGDKIAEILDYAGAYTEAIPERDFVSLSIYFPKSSAKTIIPLVASFFTEAVFSESKLEIIRNQLKRNLAVNLEKTSYLAYASFAAAVFGANHPYGVSLQIEDIDCLQKSDIASFYQKYFHGGNIRLFIAGNVDDDCLHLLEDSFGNIPCKQPVVQQIVPIEINKTLSYIERKNAVQSSICIGKRLFDYTHKDWIPMSVLTTILGGYFGSRLMTNIREDKGLTYGIYSRMLSFQLDGLFMIRADVNKDLIQQAKDEIFIEIEKLLKYPVSQKELALVKNYLSGSLLRSFDGIFSQIDRNILLSDHELTQDYWSHYMEIIRNITPETLLEQANRHLQPDSMTTIVAG